MLKGMKPKEVSILTKNSFVSDTVFGIFDHLLSQDYNEFTFTGVCTHICVHDAISALFNVASSRYNLFPKIILRTDLIEDFAVEMEKDAIRRMKTLYGVHLMGGAA